MPRSLALLIIGLLFGGGIGFLLAAANNVALDGHRHGPAGGAAAAGQGGEAHRGHGHHDGRTIALAAGPDAPTLDFHIVRDAMSGWNLQIATTGFRFAPERASAAHRAGEGHAHIYVNGRKVARVYGPWFHLGALPRGTVSIAVTLNANDHSALSVAGRPLRAMKTIRVE